MVSSAQWRRRSRLVIWALQKTLRPTNRSSCRRRAFSTRARIAADDSPAARSAVPELHRRHLDLDVDAVEQRPGDAGAVALHRLAAAAALALRVAKISTWTTIYVQT